MRPKSERDPTTLFRAAAQGLGWLAAMQVVVGFILSSFYRPTIADAHASINSAAGPFQILSGFHVWGSAAMIVLASGLVAASIFAGTYRPPRTLNYYGALIVLLSTLGLQITGNLLPMDRHDVQTVAVEAGIAGRAPGLGPDLAAFVLQGQRFSQATLQGWYGVHRWLLSPLLVLGLVLLLRGNLATRGVRFWPAIPAALVLALAAFIPGPTGDPATVADFTRQEATVGWYVWPVHALLRAFESLHPGLGWIGAFLIPGLLVTLLVAAPWMDRRVERGPVAAGFGVLLGALVIVTVAMGGRPAPLSGDQPVPEIVTPAPIRRAAKSPSLDPARIAHGEVLFRSNCAGCHGEAGKGGPSGPDLRGIHTRHPDVDWYLRFIRNPGRVKPGSPMPGFAQLDEEELRALAEYLLSPSRHVQQ